MPDLVVITKDRVVSRRRGRQPGAFTLLDVLVSIAVIGVLISLLAPSLASVREVANQVVCRSNVRQLGLGIAMYADTYQDRIPSSTLAAGQFARPWDTNCLRLAPQSGSRWDGLGYLYDLQYLPAPKVYYCPSHRGSAPFTAYADMWAGRSDESINGNYQYRGPVDPGGQSTGHPVAILQMIPPHAALAADSMRTQADFNHVVGANVLRAGLSVEWHADTGRRILDILPRETSSPSGNPNYINEVWGVLDH